MINTKIYRQPPYILFMYKGRQEFTYIGTVHSFDPKHPQYGVVELYWDEWIKDKDAAKAVVLVEGGERPVSSTKEEAITSNGEAGLLTYLASEANVVCESPEPSSEDEINQLFKKFSKEEILLYYFVRQVDQWHRYTDKPAYEDYLNQYIKHVPDILRSQDYTLSLQSLEQMYNNILEMPFDMNNRKMFNKLSNPYEKITITNKVAQHSSQIRDEHVVRRIKQHWDNGKSLFAAYGHSHVQVQEDRLRQFLR